METITELASIIAVLTIYIAYQQWNTNRFKLKLELYDKRFAVYERVKEYLFLIIQDSDVKTKDSLLFITSVSEAEFLLGLKISKYIDEIYVHSLSLHKWSSQYRDYTQKQPEGYDHKQVVDEMHKETIWLSSQLRPMKDKFKKYLDVSKL